MKVVKFTVDVTSQVTFTVNVTTFIQHSDTSLHYQHLFEDLLVYPIFYETTTVKL